MQVSVCELKDHLSHYLHKVQEGEKIVITSHRIPLATLNPFPVLKGVRLGKNYPLENVEWNGKKPKGINAPPKIQGKTVAEMILEDRR